jgi:hypothetical protein
MQSSQVRDIVEILFANFLEEYDWGCFASVQVATVSLTAVEHMTYFSFNNQVEVSFGGSVYFQDGSIDVPSQDALTELLVQGLHQDGLLLPALQAEFPQLSGTTLEALQDPTEAQSMAPTPVVTDSINRVQGGINGDGDNGGHDVGAVAGSFVGGVGIALLLGVSFLLASRRKRVVLLEEEDLQELELGLEKEDVKESTHQDLTLADTLDDAEEDASPQNQPKPVTTSTNNNYTQQVTLAEESAPRSPEPCSREELPANCRLGQMLAAAASLLQQHVHVPPEKMPDDDDDHIAFDMESVSDLSSCSAVIQHHFIPVEPMASFEHQRRNMVLKKDMMMNKEDIPFWKRPRHSTDNFKKCALKPTDHSAATLAIATTSRPPHPAL